jgi:hypothetical protein
MWMKTPAWTRGLCALLLLAGCGDEPGSPTPDASVELPDSGTPTPPDGGVEQPDSGTPPDGGVGQPDSGTPPDAPTWAQDNPILANDNAPRLRVHAEPGLRVELFATARCEGTPLQSTRASSTGLALFEVHVGDDVTALFSARVIDHAEKASGCSSPYVYTEDSRPPEAPQWSPAPPTSSSVNALTLGLKAEAGSRVELFATGDCTGEARGSATADSSGRVAFGVTVEDDTTSHFSARATDGAGNASACAPAHTYVEDSSAPGVPVLLSSEPASPGRTRSPVLTGTTEPGATVILYADEPCTGTERGSAKADTSGSFRVVGSADANTSTRFRVRARDAAGNTSACSAGLSYVHDAAEPALPTLKGFTPGSPANANSPVLSGTAEAGARLRVFPGSSCQGEPVAVATVGTEGLFLATLSVADDTTTTFSAHAVDAAGNTSGCAASTPFVEDSHAPEAPSSLKTTPDSPGANNTVSLSGSTEAGNTVLLFTAGECTGSPAVTGTADGTGRFSLTVTVADNSTTAFHVAARDRAGNTSACAGPVVYVEDSTPPESASARVTDGPGEDLELQLDATTAEAHWEGFSDGRGPLTYEHLLARDAACTDVVAPALSTGTQTVVKRTGLSLADRSYHHCVRARNALGAVSGWVASNGFRVDVSAPWVQETTPANDATNVDLRAALTVRFSEPVDAASVTAASFTLERAGSRLAGKVECSGAVCTFTPESALPHRETLTATLTTGVKDLSGRPLSAPYTFRFTTRGTAWADQPVRAEAEGTSLSPEVGLDGQGRALAVWLQETGGHFRPVAARHAPGTGWSTALALDTTHPGDAANLTVAVNEAGRGVATWVLQDGAQADLYAAEYLPDSGWGPPELLEHRSEPAGSPRVVVDKAGNALLVWRQSDGTAESLWAARREPGMGWSEPLLLETDAGPIFLPTLAAESSGRALAAWPQQESEGRVLLRVSRFVPGTGWTSAESLAQDAAGFSATAAMSTDGSAFVLFRRSTASGLVPYASRFIPGLGWGMPEALPGGTIPGEDLGVAMDRLGRALAVWTGPNASGVPIPHFARFTPETGWRTVDFPLESPSHSAAVAVDGQGNFHIAWVESYSYYRSDLVFALRLREGASILDYTEYYLLDAYPITAGNSKRPRLAANQAGEAVGVWYRDDGTGFSTNRVLSSTFN